MNDLIILSLEGVTKQFSPTVVPAVNQITLQLHQGVILGLLGPSGCGKTTLLRLIAGFEQPQAGTIELAGQVVAGKGQWVSPEQRNVGMVFQDYALFPHLTVVENIAFGLKHRSRRSARRFTSKQVKQLTIEAITRVGLEGLEQRYPHQLSGGQQQRVALARALAPQPALILLDEPLSNLDAQVRQKLRQDIRHILKAAGTTAVFVTHDQEEALSISDQVAVMQRGKVEQLGTPEQIYHEPASRFVAEFVTQANFLPARRKGQFWETEVGQFEAVAATDLPSTLWELMIRQEDLTLEPSQNASVVICDRQFLGREHRYCLLTPSGQELHARTNVELDLPVGTHVQLSATRTALRAFPKVEDA